MNEVVKFLIIKYCFFLQTFFNSGAMGSVCDTFCIYHVIAPGQEPGAEDLPEGFCYPTMDELSEQVSYFSKFSCMFLNPDIFFQFQF